MSNIYIITDSAADILPELAKKKNIRILPLTITHGGKIYKDGIDIGTNELLQMLETDELPKTSQVNPQEFLEVYSEILKQEDCEIISIHISSKLSGIYQSAMIAKDMLGTDRIHIIDSKMVSFSTGLLAIEAANMIEKNYTIDKILENLNDMLPRLRIAFFVNTLEYLKKGGRISSVKAAVGNLLNLKPVIYIKDGCLDVLDKPRGTKKAYSRLIQYLEEEGIDKSLGFCVGNVGCRDDGDEFKATISEIFNINIDEIYTTDAGASVTTYAGRGTIGIYFFSKK